MNTLYPLLLGGLTLFFLGIAQLSSTLRTVLKDRAKEVLGRFTKNILYGIATGTLLTFLLDSSSAVIIMAIILVNADTLTFRQAMGVVMGANIGTTLSSQIIALDIAQYSVIPLFIGLIMLLYFKDRQRQMYGKVILYFGLLFFGIFIMEYSVNPLRESELFEHWIEGIEDNYIKGTLIGGGITAIIQSSSATVGMVIVLGKQGLIQLKGAVSIMLGAELGTCTDTLLATIRGRRQAVKTGLFHLTFNLLTIVFGLIAFYPFVALVESISGSASLGNQIAISHILFNVLGVILFLPFTGLTERLLNRLIPEKQKTR